jgi:hypothetical protein
MTLKPLIFIIAFSAGQSAAQTFSVCEVLASMTALNGKTVAVRGVWRRGDAGQELRAAGPCERPTVRNGWQFFDAIDVVPDRGNLSVANYYAEYNGLRQHHPGNVNILATLQGRLDVRDRFSMWTDGFGKLWPDVFRHYFVARLGFWSADHLQANPYRAGEAEEEQRAGWGNPLPRRVE